MLFFISNKLYGYSVAAPVVDHHHHQHQQPISNGYAVDNHQHQQQAVDGYAVGHDFHQKRNTEAPTIPVHNLYTVDAYQSVLTRTKLTLLLCLIPFLDINQTLNSNTTKND